MSNTREIPVHTAKVIIEISMKPSSFNQIYYKYKLSPSTLARNLRFLRSSGFIEVVIIKHDKREGMMKAYKITERGKKVVSLFKRLEETEEEIFGMVKK